MSSLHSALETWTVLANRSVQEGTGKKVEFGHYYCAVCFFMIHVYWVRGKKREHFFFSHPVKLTHRLKHEKFGNLISLHKYYRLHLFKQYLLFFLQIDLQHFVNPEETCHYLLIIAGMFGLVNQVNCKEIEGCFWGLSHGTITNTRCVRFFLLISSKRTRITVVC